MTKVTNCSESDAEHALLAFHRWVTKLQSKVPEDVFSEIVNLYVAFHDLCNGYSKIDPVFALTARFMKYGDYLKTDHWAFIRNQTLEMWDSCCLLCNAKAKEMHAHHRTYKRLGMETDCDVVLLCADCHQLFHEHKTAEMQKTGLARPATDKSKQIKKANNLLVQVTQDFDPMDIWRKAIEFMTGMEGDMAKSFTSVSLSDCGAIIVFFKDQYLVQQMYRKERRQKVHDAVQKAAGRDVAVLFICEESTEATK